MKTCHSGHFSCVTVIIVLIILCSGSPLVVRSEFSVTSRQDLIKIQIGQWSQCILHFSPSSSAGNHTITANFSAASLAVYPKTVEIVNFSNEWQHEFNIHALKLGKFKVTFGTTTELLVEVFSSSILLDASSWMKIAWFSFTFFSVYPQLIVNYLRRSSAGLNSDYVAFNICGFVTWALYAFAHFQSDTKKDYTKHYNEFTENLNGFFLAINGSIVSILICVQHQALNFHRHRGTKFIEISQISRTLLAATAAAFISSMLAVKLGAIHYRDFLFLCFIIYLGATGAKYIPQILQNFRDEVVAASSGFCVWTCYLESAGIACGIIAAGLDEHNFGDVSKLLEHHEFWLRLCVMASHCFLVAQKVGCRRNFYYVVDITVVEIHCDGA